MTRYALVIGVSEYQSSSLSKLPKAATDAEEVAKVLETHGKFHVERLPKQWNKETNHWEVAEKPVTKTEVINELQTLLWKRAARSEVLIYFAGHGIRAFDELEELQGFLAVSNCNVQLKEGKVVKQENGIPLDIIDRLISNEKCRVSSLVMLLDCCHSGLLLEDREIRKTLTVFGSRNDYYLIAGCRIFEKARAFKGEANSIFTGALLKGLSVENANSDGTVTTQLVFNAIDNELKDSGQEPICMGGGRSITLVQYSPDTVKESSLNVWEKLWNKATSTNVKVQEWGKPSIDNLDIKLSWEQNEDEVLRFPWNSKVYYEFTFQESGYFLLLQKFASGKLFCLAPSFLVKSYVKPKITKFPDSDNSIDLPYIEIDDVHVGTEEVLAIVTQKQPEFSWLPSVEQEPVCINENHLLDLLDFLDEEQQFEIIKTKYEIVASG